MVNPNKGTDGLLPSTSPLATCSPSDTRTGACPAHFSSFVLNRFVYATPIYFGTLPTLWRSFYRITSKTALYVFVDLRFDSKTTKTKMIFQNPLYPNLISCESTTSKIRPAPCSSISLRISVCRASDPVIRPRLGDAPLSYAVCRGPP